LKIEGHAASDESRLKGDGQRQPQSQILALPRRKLLLCGESGGPAYRFPIPLEDAKGTTLFAEFKAITLMRWIRKALEHKTFQPAS
jgi:hypothetical protein